MKQKVVMKVQMKDQKARSKALKVVVGVPGVLSAGIEGEGKDQIVVIGDGVDAATLTCLLRKRVGFTELVRVSPAYATDRETARLPIVWSYQASQAPQGNTYMVHDPKPDPCSIL